MRRVRGSEGLRSEGQPGVGEAGTEGDLGLGGEVEAVRLEGQVRHVDARDARVPRWRCEMHGADGLLEREAVVCAANGAHDHRERLAQLAPHRADERLPAD